MQHSTAQMGWDGMGPAGTRVIKESSGLYNGDTTTLMATTTILILRAPCVKLTAVVVAWRGMGEIPGMGFYHLPIWLRPEFCSMPRSDLGDRLVTYQISTLPWSSGYGREKQKQIIITPTTYNT